MMNKQLLKRTAMLLVCGIVASLGLPNCSDTTVGPGDSGSDTLADTAVSINFFPNFRDIVWIYEIYDSLAEGVSDTVTVTIKDLRFLPPDLFPRVWEAFHRVADRTDTTFVRVEGDSVQFYSSSAPIIDFDLFLLPLSENKRWEDPALFGADSGGALAIDSISVPAGDFPIAARVLNGWETDFKTGGNLITSWVVDSIGIVLKQDLKRVVIVSDTIVESNIVWRLLFSSLIMTP